MYFKRLNYEADTYVVTDKGRYKPHVKTKWHKLKERDGRVFRAVCGYEYDFLMETPNTAHNAYNMMVCEKCEPESSKKELPLDAPF